MGMDVCGRAPTSKEGEYFRNNVWWWHPLWNYCCQVAPTLCSKVEHGHSNDGDGLGGEDSIKLAKVLRIHLESGSTAQFEKEYTERLNNLPKEDCRICGATGKRLPPPECGPGDINCNGCSGEGKVKPWAASYPFSAENVKEFATFLENCGGFSIC